MANSSDMTHLMEVRVQGLPDPLSHYSDAVVAGSTVYISGLISTNAEGFVVGKDDIVEQARQIFRNLAMVLRAVGGTPSDVVKVTVFMRDARQRSAINPVREEFFGVHRPASTLVGINHLVDDELLLEIEAVAVLKDAPNKRD